MPSLPTSVFTPKRHPAGSGVDRQTHAGAGVQNENTLASQAFANPPGNDNVSFQAPPHPGTSGLPPAFTFPGP